MKNISTDTSSPPRSLLKYLTLFGGISLFNLFFAALRQKLTALLLGPSGLGVIGLYQSLVVFIAQFSSWGMLQTGLPYVNQITRLQCYRLDQLRSWGLLFALCGSISALLLLPYLVPSLSFFDRLYLALAILFTALNVVEQVVLKSFRKLTALGFTSFYTTLLSLPVALGLYFWYGVSAIPGVLFLIQLGAFFFILWTTLPLHPFRLYYRLKDGRLLWSKGGALVLSLLLSTGVDFYVRNFIQSNLGYEYVGYYTVSMVLLVSYLGVFLSSVDHDYFSRLIAVNNSSESVNNLVDQQVRMTFLLLSTVLFFLLALLPWVISLLYRDDFLIAVEIIYGASLFALLRPLILPLSYLTLVKQDQGRYFILEVLASVLTGGFSILGYYTMGLLGLGLGLSVTAVVEALILALHARSYYGVKLTDSTWQGIGGAVLVLILLFVTRGNMLIQLLFAVAYMGYVFNRLDEWVGWKSILGKIGNKYK